eukprot:CAMPEP_0183719988 /NCGR_PEP_ID=MMETSP0737-20130205/12738_1 /TAXON_ID=385413 /ORGANISM="Thalassiosira miniscula, Strain CCMP1093" /LENGTH=133 /DNA_ID=CAMNT_0025949783 /DNA_START=158 /DNA_END=559 /DNA_ORIENTATION=-
MFHTSHSFAVPSSSPSTGKNSGPEAYVLIEAKLKPTELERFGSYASRVPSVVEKYGGQYIVLGGNHEPLEGDWGETRLVLHKWPNAECARQFWNSEEYRELKDLREGTGDFRIMLLEGLDKSDLEQQEEAESE